MNVQNINLFKLNNSYTQQKNPKQFNKQNQTYPQINEISNHYYVPFCGNKKEKNNIQKFLNDKSLEPDKKDYLTFLTTIDGFVDASKGMGLDELRHFLNVCLFFSPITDDVLKGNYACIFDNKEKPLFDLKSIAKYNKKHPQNPQNLNDMLFGDNVLIKIFLSTLRAKKINQLAAPLEFSYFADEDRSLKLNATIKYSPKKNVSLNEIKKYADMPLNENAKMLFGFKSISGDMKKTLWELTEIPYFNALSKNLSIDQLKLITELSHDNKAYVLEALKGNVKYVDKETLAEIPIINLEKVVKENLLSNFQKQKDMSIEFLSNKLFKTCYEESFLYKNTMQQYPRYFFSLESNPDTLVSSFHNFTKEELISSYANPELKVNHLIVFENDLNKIANLTSKEESKEAQEEIIEQKSSPKSIRDFLADPKNDNESKKAAYDMEEIIPHFNSIMQNSTQEDIKLLVSLQKKNPQLFAKLMQGKVKIDGLILIDTKDIAIKKGHLNSLIKEKSFYVEVFNELSTMEKLFGEKIKKFDVKVDFEKPATYHIEFFQNEKPHPNINIAMPGISEIFFQYLTAHNSTEFTISIDE